MSQLHAAASVALSDPAYTRDGSRSASACHATRPLPSLKDVSVLVVEDDAVSAKLLAVLLRGEGCITHVARSAEEALARIDHLKPAVIVLDLVLPLMSGFLFAQTVKAMPSMRHVVIIAVSSINGLSLERAALSAGCDGFLRKPIDVLTFTALLQRHLGER